MAYNVSNWGLITGGSTITVGFIFGSGQSQGAQFAEGFPEDAGSTLLVNNEGISFGDNSEISYQFDLTCAGRTTRFGLDGGGLS